MGKSSDEWIRCWYHITDRMIDLDGVVDGSAI